MSVRKQTVLLTVDAIVNLVLGALLMVFPAGVVEVLGIPATAVAFYPSILGAVLFGIGIALWIGRSGSASGLGLSGAVSINLCGGIVLALWLVFGRLGLETRGYVVLWALVVLLIGLSTIEISAEARSGNGEN